MTEISVYPADYQDLIRTAVAIKFLIYVNGGGATKSIVEDVLMMRLPSVDRSLAHGVMNDIEFHGFDAASIRNKQWRFDETAGPQLSEYPEIGKIERIRWYRGKPECFN